MFVVIAIYVLIILLFIVGLIRLPKTEIDTNLDKQKFSIIIPFRNEEESLGTLLKSIQDLSYQPDAFEVLFIDDESTDNSVKIIKKWQENLTNIRLYPNKRHSNSPKKDAIQVGLKNCKFDYIITTDADCVLPKNWLYAYNTSIQKKQSLFLAGPIALKNSKNLIDLYQKYDSLSLIGVTMGSFGINKPMMCNAANMGFDKKSYLKILNSHNHIASGDDIFTLENFIKNTPEKIHYLNSTDALVYTKTENSWHKIIQQHVRWAAKSTHYKSLFTKFVGLIVLITQLSIIIGLFIQPLITVFIWIVKLGFDFILIWIAAEKTEQKTTYIYYILMAIIYPFLNTYIGIKALFGGYTWKERKFKR